MNNALHEMNVRGHIFRIMPIYLWHATHAKGILLNTARLGQGIVYSISYIRELELDGAITSYGAFNSNPDKEDAWEKIRLAEFPFLPTRKHSIFLFDCSDDAELACRTWFANECRLIVKAQIVVGSTVHIADTSWLDCEPDQWESHARAYWRGEVTNSPRREVIVHGPVYFPDWESEPFGCSF
ncbi:hypothetical protein [Xanthobacter sp. 126]|uniref:hypothetical protein n=1 Tax=Xanthobacter sp. 126 TaxID=1131814 RepID=UPI0012DE4620|nr:hypothetical protein [Xanthobacter sp. 126]